MLLVGSKDQILGLLDARRVFPWFSLEVEVPVFPRGVYGLAVPYCESLTTPGSDYVAVSSARVKVQGGKKERKIKIYKQKTNIEQN